MFDIKTIDTIAAAFRVGGAGIGTSRPIIGTAMVGLGEAISLIANVVNKRRYDLFCSSLEKHSRKYGFIEAIEMNVNSGQIDPDKEIIYEIKLCRVIAIAHISS